MREGAESMIEGYGKPVLKHHNALADPIGRVVGAAYVDTTAQVSRDMVAGNVVDGLNSPRTPFIKIIDLIDKFSESELLRDPKYPGLGHIMVEAEITDEDALRKIVDKRYLTVSIGATTDKAVCSVCKTDWTEEGKCEHTPGKKYEDKLCFIIAGNLVYDEVSFVNTPADPFAQVISVNRGTGLTDDVKVEATAAHEIDAKLSLQDIIGGNSMNPIKEAWKKVTELVSEEEAKKEDSVKALEGFLAEFKDQFEEEDPCRKEAEEKLAELKVEDNTDDSDIADAGPDKLSFEMTDEEWEISDKHYDDMVEFGYDLGFIEPDFADAKLSAEQRKKMSKSTFCWPSERKYPVPDCSHARVAMAYAKKNNHSNVIPCIRRKAKALGCPFGEAKKKKDGTVVTGIDAWELEIEEVLAYAEEQKAIEAGTQKPADAVDNPPEEVPPEEPCEGCTDMKDQLVALRRELQDSYNDASELEEVFLGLLKQLRVELADSTTKLEIVAGNEIEDAKKRTEELAVLNIEDLLQKSAELKDSLDLEAISTKLNDGMSREPDEVVDNPVVDSADDPTASQDEELFTRVKETYQKKLTDGALGEADAYILSLKQARIIPTNFDPTK
jgi:hypothetical protein